MTVSTPIPRDTHADLLHLGLGPADVQWPPKVRELADAFAELEVVELVGLGGSGAVYRVRRRADGTDLALKILRPDLMAQSGLAVRFRREVEALARLNHPSIVKISTFGERCGWFFVEMEYVAGGNLRAQMDGPLQPARACSVMDQVCAALQYTHEVGVVHRDVKPENVLIDAVGDAKLADFGLAKLRDTDTMWTLTGSQMMLGTPLYLAPEQIHTPRAVDQRADIYSVGVVLYELLTGRLPIGRFGKPSSLAKVNRKLDRLVMRALQTDPDERFQEIGQLRGALSKARAGPRRRPTRSTMMAVGMAVGMSLAGGAALMHGVGSETETEDVAEEASKPKQPDSAVEACGATGQARRAATWADAERMTGAVEPEQLRAVLNAAVGPPCATGLGEFHKTADSHGEIVDLQIVDRVPGYAGLAALVTVGFQDDTVGRFWANLEHVDNGARLISLGTVLFDSRDQKDSASCGADAPVELAVDWREAKAFGRVVAATQGPELKRLFNDIDGPQCDGAEHIRGNLDKHGPVVEVRLFPMYLGYDDVRVYGGADFEDCRGVTFTAVYDRTAEGPRLRSIYDVTFREWACGKGRR